MDKRESILSATLKLTEEVGLVEISTALIAKEAQVGMGTIYRYFKSKEHLLQALFEKLRDKLTTLVLTSFSPTLAPYENFAIVIRNLLTYYPQNIREFKFLETYSDLTYDIPERIDDTLLPLEPIATFLSGWGDSIKLKPMPIDVIFSLVYGPLVAVTNLVHRGKLELTDELIEQIASACWDAITEKT